MALPEMPPRVAQDEHSKEKGGDGGSRFASRCDLRRLPVSRAKTSATPGSEPESPESGRDCGQNLPESFAFYDPDTSSWKTSQRSLFEEWVPFSETWPRSGTMRNGRCYRREPLVPTTFAKGRLWLPTPTTVGNQSCPSMAKNGRGCKEAIEKYRGCYTNPEWVEEFMGFPRGHTALEDSEMPSSRKSPNGSGDE